MNLLLNNRQHYLLLLFFLLLLTLLPILLFLDVHAIRIWDEARQAYSAAYMVLHKNYLVTHFRNEPDLWNTKPPLLIWLQAFSMHLFGITAFAIRFPVMLAVLATVWLLLWFGWRILKFPLAAVFGVLVLLSSRGYMGRHVALTGDYDGLLTLFIFVYSLFFFRYLETKQEKFWLLIGGALILAALTKGVAALLPLPALALYALLSGNLIFLLRSKGLYLSMLAFIVIVGSFYFWREQASPGFWQAVYENELGGRFLNALEAHDKPWYYFFTGGKFMPWLFFLPVCLYLIYRQSQSIVRRFSLFALCFYAVLLLIISIARTKLPWYDAPVYPFISLLVGIGLNLLYERLIRSFPARKTAIMAGFTLLLFIPYGLLAARAAAQDKKDKQEPVAALGYLLHDFNQKFPTVTNYTVLTAESYHGPLDFYVLKYAAEGDTLQDGRIENITADLQPSEVILISEPGLKDQLLTRYQVKELYKSDYGVAVSIMDRK